MRAATVFKVAGIGVGAAAAVDVGRYVWGERRVSDGGVASETLTGIVLSHKHTAGSILSEIGHPTRVVALAVAGKEALAREQALFGRGILVADGANDAFRHTYWGALMTSELVTRANMPPEAAGDIARGVGRAHEDDSRLTGDAYRYSRAMDELNNDVGIRIAQQLLASGAEPPGGMRAALQARVLAAIREGETVVIDGKGQPPRASTDADLANMQSAKPPG